MSFITEHAVKAVRKQHRCDVCCQFIAIGQPAVRWAGKPDGDFATAAFHPDCRAAEIAFNEASSRTWGEWYSLAHDRDAADNAWLLSDYPAVAERMGIRTLKDTSDAE